MPKVYIETYGCQMNVADSEVVAAILIKQDFELSKTPEDADLILVNTCSIRDNAEKKVKSRLGELGTIKKSNGNGKLGIIGCMAERLKEELIEDLPAVDIIAGPDSYRDLPRLLTLVSSGEKGINTQLSMEETYSEINPVRMDENRVSAFISIMRGCNNFCSYCVVPYTRGRERSRDLNTILKEMENLKTEGYKEVTLLGQNVNSWKWQDPQNGKTNFFPELLRITALTYPGIRIRFATSHPKDLSDEVLHVINDHPNLCRHIHLPVQSGSDRILKRMNRNYTSLQYLDRIKAIKSILPDASISTDIIAGFSGETEEDHQETIRLMKEVGYDFAYMFKYSERPGTRAADKFPDDVPEEVKTRRLNEIIELQNNLSFESKHKDLGKTFQVLIEGESKRSKDHYFGRNSQNKVVVFPKSIYKTGDYANVKIENHTSATLIGKPV
ncbi:MAG: tRNA (N6-isopentenyl adenosine(37)-C2)-methylthiotransferase MiaB [Bacteroidales bacterium]